jgi:hypothetical protein
MTYLHILSSKFLASIECGHIYDVARGQPLTSAAYITPTSNSPFGEMEGTSKILPPNSSLVTQIDANN